MWHRRYEWRAGWYYLCAMVLASSVALPAAALALPSLGVPVPCEAVDVDLEARMDRFFDQCMGSFHVPGATCVIVKDGSVRFMKAYGYADLSAHAPISARGSLLRVGSISKLVTSVAIMQLVERGQVSLDQDVNSYLTSFQVPATYTSPVTVAHLLTHTGGFDERVTGIVAAHGKSLPLGAYLSLAMPPRIRAPGEFILYSNHGMALAGHVVELASGRTFEDYARHDIFEPLGMRHSSFKVVAPDLPHLALGYEYKDGAYVPLPVECPANIGPSVGMTTTAADMGRFLVALLQTGSNGSVRILGEAVSRDMQCQHFTHDARLPGLCYGFMEQWPNGAGIYGPPRPRAIGHTGAWWGFASAVWLIPEEHLGWFVCFNRQLPFLPDRFSREVLEYFRPATPDPLQSRYAMPSTKSGGHTPLAVREIFRDSADYNRDGEEGWLGSQGKPDRSPWPNVALSWTLHAEEVAGLYRDMRYSRSTWEKVLSLGCQMRVSANANGTIMIRRLLTSPPAQSHWREVAPFLFEEVQGSGRVAFRDTGHGSVDYFYLDQRPFERIEWFEGAPVQVSLFATYWIIHSSAVIGWPLSAAVRRMRRKPAMATPVSRVPGLLVYTNSVLIVIFLSVVNVFLIGYVFHLYQPGLLLSSARPWGALPLLFLPIIFVAATLPLPLCVALVWKRRYWSPLGRIHYSLVCLGSVTLVPFLLYWNLLTLKNG
jgi:CubicO group peptidase (beta-lactamase class C family)